MIASSGLPHAQGERAAPDVNGRHASQRYLLISSTPDSLGDLIAALLTQAAEVTITNPEAADRHRVLALRPDVVLLQVGSLAQLQEAIEELRSWRAMTARVARWARPVSVGLSSRNTRSTRRPSRPPKAIGLASRANMPKNVVRPFHSVCGRA